MQVNITLNTKTLSECNIDDEKLPEFVCKLGVTAKNEAMMKRFKVFTADIQEDDLERLRAEPAILEVALDTKRVAI
ncbi:MULTISPECIES: hypothetical protein [Vibrio]|uniref:hypothetical protein n=1 Tax=Vibrio TaxID=662 RepID=UPI00078D255F|nr:MULTISPECIES: hypothetical protein [Vibrio]BAU70901.1 hypothetical protein [Vibrio sp. 04Ya108]BBM67842.1 hypothetical protein VA249_44880 [Vibrio alfacsensis]BCN27012.1 hypothetical protein VYA_42040 [Vibrio alfacsensis]